MSKYFKFQKEEIWGCMGDVNSAAWGKKTTFFRLQIVYLPVSRHSCRLLSHEGLHLLTSWQLSLDSLMPMDVPVPPHLLFHISTSLLPLLEAHFPWIENTLSVNLSDKKIFIKLIRKDKLPISRILRRIGRSTIIKISGKSLSQILHMACFNHSTSHMQSPWSNSLACNFGYVLPLEGQLEIVQFQNHVLCTKVTPISYVSQELLQFLTSCWTTATVIGKDMNWFLWPRLSSVEHHHYSTMGMLGNKTDGHPSSFLKLDDDNRIKDYLWLRQDWKIWILYKNL